MSITIPETVRITAKRAVERAATGSGLTALSRWLRRDSVAILAYHNVVPVREAGRGDSSLHMPLPTFIEQVERLTRTHDIVDLETALGEQGVTAPGRPQAVITFDDAYRGAVTLGLRELARRDIPATVFVSPGLLGAPGTWWDELAEAGLLSPQVRHDALVDLGGRAEAIRSHHLEGSPQALPASYGISTVEELQEQTRAGVTIGSHAWAHEHLPSLEPDQLEANLRMTLQWLEAFPGHTNRWLALPYGAGSARTTRVAMDTGHTGVLRIRGGLWEQGDDRGLVPRINVPGGISVRGLELRTSGLLG